MDELTEAGRRDAFGAKNALDELREDAPAKDRAGGRKQRPEFDFQGCNLIEDSATAFDPIVT